MWVNIMTARQKFFQDIIQIVTGWTIPISFTHDECCTLRYTSTMRGDIVRKVEPIKFIFSYKMNYWDDIYNYLTPEQQKVWTSYHPYLFSILHEIGHIYTLVGVDYKEHSTQKKNIRNVAKNYADICARYRKLKVEALADQWATDWVLDHTDLAQALSDKITKEYK